MTGLGMLLPPMFTKLFFPTRWHYDVLRGLHYLRDAYPGEVYFDMDDGEGSAQPRNTLRAMRVPRWYDEAHGNDVGGKEATR